jgi:PAS domain S-box-containing protein
MRVDSKPAPRKDFCSDTSMNQTLPPDEIEPKTHERELERLNRLYAALSRINQAIIRTPERLDLFQGICQALVDQGGFAMAWIGWHAPDLQKLVPEAAWGRDVDYLKNIEVYTDDRQEGRGPSGTAFREGRPYICNDLLNDPGTLPWRIEYGRHGFHASAAFPIRLNDRVSGVLTVYAFESDFFKDKEISLLMEAAADISFALDNSANLKHGRIANHRFEMLARATNDAVRDWDLKTNSVWWNEGFETLFGFRRDENEASIDSWRDRIHPEDRERVSADLEKVMQSRELWSSRYRFRRRDGTYAHVTDRGQVIRDENGKAVRMLAGMRDITERVGLEDQLRQSQRLEAVGQLTGGVAHDFNNLLTVILGNGELLLEQLENDSLQRELADMIVGAAKNAAELTERLLAFARKQALNPIAVDSNQWVSGMYPLLRRTLGAHIEIEIVPRQGLWQALVDPAQLENALLNLCINARDAMSAGGRLLIETNNVELDQDYASGQADVKPGEYVLIAVTDSGSGIPAEILLRVFEPFFTTKDKGKGTGLGLAMVYGFIKQSGGHVSIYSEPGQGTVVKMYLPRVVEPYAPPPEATGTFRVIHGTETILLVEDDEQVRRLGLSQLKSLGYNVLHARDGVEALEILARDGDIDLLFTDVVMPRGISGRQLADAARQRRPDLKVLFTSGYTEDAIVHHGRLDPGVQLLPKPYRRRELARRIRSILDAQGGHAGDSADAGTSSAQFMSRSDHLL